MACKATTTAISALTPTFYLGLGWQALPLIKLHASTGWGYGPPGLQERFVPFVGNPDLAEEEGFTSDVGFDWQLRPDMLFSVSGYYSRYEGLIVPVFRPELALFVPGNIRQARLQGIEAEWRYAVHDGIKVGADYTYASSRDLDTGTVLPRRPRHRARVFGEWALQALPLTLWLEGTYRGRQSDDTRSTLIVEEVFRLNAQASYRYSQALAIYVRGENLTDAKTSEAFRFGFPGRAIYGGLRLSLD